MTESGAPTPGGAAPGGAPSAAMIPSATTPGATVGVLWHQLLSRWDDADAHAAFLRVAQESGRLADAAMHYRGMTGDRERAAVAERQLEAITVLALSGLEGARTKPPSKRRVGGYAALAVGLIFVGVLIILASALR